ncbi:hypothetical protein HCG51_09635 [Tolypothrix sp. PCC 7910]|uniref:hypothetical protein n=1 Tax=Tolypothrix sp. PCC 7910 TaxID=2099387 RepID=UPI001427893E|nr:hypothetical protein [Tolypothrix sp. PCC 7910]QIR36971.1 hypothetical protein HCG51_09635 [Tolypothrix sp. PCC 7910]
MSNNQPIPTSSTNPRNDLLLEIEQTPEQYIPELLQFVRLFRQSVVMKQTALNDWEKAMNELNHSNDTKKQDRVANIKSLFDSWKSLDEHQEQQDTLKIIESMKGISI